MPEILDRTAPETVLEDATEDYWAGSGAGPEDEEPSHNETREALIHEASDQDTVSMLCYTDNENPIDLHIDH